MSDRRQAQVACHLWGLQAVEAFHVLLPGLSQLRTRGAPTLLSASGAKAQESAAGEVPWRVPGDSSLPVLADLPLQVCDDLFDQFREARSGSS